MLPLPRSTPELLLAGAAWLSSSTEQPGEHLLLPRPRLLPSPRLRLSHLRRPGASRPPRDANCSRVPTPPAPVSSPTPVPSRPRRLAARGASSRQAVAPPSAALPRGALARAARGFLPVRSTAAARKRPGRLLRPEALRVPAPAGCVAVAVALVVGAAEPRRQGALAGARNVTLAVRLLLLRAARHQVNDLLPVVAPPVLRVVATAVRRRGGCVRGGCAAATAFRGRLLRGERAALGPPCFLRLCRGRRRQLPLCSLLLSRRLRLGLLRGKVSWSGPGGAATCVQLTAAIHAVARTRRANRTSGAESDSSSDGCSGRPSPSESPSFCGAGHGECRELFAAAQTRADTGGGVQTEHRTQRHDIAISRVGGLEQPEASRARHISALGEEAPRRSLGASSALISHLCIGCRTPRFWRAE